MDPTPLAQADLRYSNHNHIAGSQYNYYTQPAEAQIEACEYDFLVVADYSKI